MIKKILPLLFVILPVFFSGCSETPTGVAKSNLPPTTKLFLYPDSTISQQPSRLKVYWWGDDPDGLIVGFYFTWDDINWTFTTKNDSLFALQIGAADTNYIFKVAAADNGGNGFYDNQVVQNGINFGPEPFIDANGNGKWDVGEKFYDIGLIDPNPASIPIPIKNTEPEIFWDSLSVLPAETFPVISVRWFASDLDGDETIQKIEIVLNDTSNISNYVALRGSVRLITLRVRDFNSPNPDTEILIDGAEFNINPERLKGIRLDDTNRIFVRAVDISGATTPFISLPGANQSWFVKKPKGKFLLIDDYATNDGSDQFYVSKLDSLNGGVLSGKYDILRISGPKRTFFTYDFILTLKLYRYVLWYSDGNPSITYAQGYINQYLNFGGKVFLAMMLPRTPPPEAIVLQDFLPIDSLSNLVPSIPNSTELIPDVSNPGSSSYPILKASISVFSMFGMYTSSSALNIYKTGNNTVPGSVGFFNSTKTLFYLGVPLHRFDANNNAIEFLRKVIFEDFAYTP